MKEVTRTMRKVCHRSILVLRIFRRESIVPFHAMRETATSFRKKVIAVTDRVNRRPDDEVKRRENKMNDVSFCGLAMIRLTKTSLNEKSAHGDGEL